MKIALAVLVGLFLLFGCIGQQESGPRIVDVTQGTGAQETQGAENAQGGPVVVDISQSPGTAGSGQVVEEPEETSREISFRTKDSWDIHATIYYAKSGSPNTGIILIHQLGGNRSDYDTLVPVLHKEMPNADIMAIDIRGHGKSTNIATYQKFKLAGDYRAMVNDIRGAVDYLKFHRNMPDNFYLVGASIGSTAAINYAAEDSAVQRVVMLSPGMNYKGVEIKQPLEDYRKRLLIVAAESDSSATDAQIAYSASKSADIMKELKIYKGMSSHGTDMSAESENSGQGRLTDVIAGWLKQ